MSWEHAFFFSSGVAYWGSILAAVAQNRIFWKQASAALPIDQRLERLKVLHRKGRSILGLTLVATVLHGTSILCLALPPAVLRETLIDLLELADLTALIGAVLCTFFAATGTLGQILLRSSVGRLRRLEQTTQGHVATATICVSWLLIRHWMG